MTRSETRKTQPTCTKVTVTYLVLFCFQYPEPHEMPAEW